MKKELQKMAEKIYRQYVNKKRWHKAVMAMAAVVVFCTTYALVLPAITLESKCGMEEHTHVESCYEKVVSETTRTLACTYESLEVHTHVADCYDGESNLLCGMIDYVAHGHNDDCVDENGNVVCQLPVIKAHEHTDACYQIPEVIESVEDVHVHDESCYSAERGKLICQLEETEAHHHTDECYEMTSVISCGLEDGVSAETTVSEMPEPEMICNEPAVMEHVHGESCFVTETVEDQLNCTLTENHIHGELCYGNWNLICEKNEHTHTDACKTIDGIGETNVQEETVPDETLSASAIENITTLDTMSEETSILSNEEEVEGTIYAEGKVTDTVWWKIVDDEFGYRTLIIGGEGPMPDFASNNDQPWIQYATAFDLIDIRDGITYIGKSAFHWNRVNDIRIGTGVKKINNYAFGYMYKKDAGEGITLRIPGNVETLEGGIFSYSSAFKEIILEEGVKEIIGNPFLNYHRSLERVYFPASLTSVSSFGGTYTYNCGVQSEFIVAEDNPMLYTENGGLYKRETDTQTGREKLTLIGYPSSSEETSLIISGIDAIAEGVFCASSTLTEVIISGAEERPIVIEGGSLFRSSKILETITLNEYVTIKNANYIFQWCTSLNSVTIPNGATVKWYQSFDGASAITEFTLSEDITDVSYYAFKDTYALEKLIYDSSYARIEYNSFGTGYYPQFDLVIGTNVDTLYESPGVNRGFSTIASRAKSVKFVGENQITIDSGALKGAGAPLDDISGTVWVDTQGVVYQYEKGSLNAKVIYISPDITEITIPESITVENENYTVNCIGAYAFQASDTVNLTIQTPQNISIVEDYAFANCTTLNSINDATTIIDAAKILVQAAPNDNAFYNTALERSATGDESGSIGTETLNDIFVLVADNDDADAKLTVSTSKRNYYTGEQAITTISLSNPQKSEIKNKKFRIYFSASDTEITRDKKESFSIVSDSITIPVTLKDTGKTGLYYFEFFGEDIGSATFSFSQIHTYPSPDSDGGELEIWIEVYDKTEAVPDVPEIDTDRMYQKLSWTTVPATPVIMKNRNGTAVLTASDNKQIAEIHNLSYKVAASVERALTAGLENCGIDFVRTLEFEDTLLMPNNFWIRENVASKIAQGQYSVRYTSNTTAQINVKIDGIMYEVCTISAQTSNLSNLSASIVSGNLKLKWLEKNTSSELEITSDTWTITYGNQIICANVQDISNLNTEERSVIFHNDVDVTSHYNYLKTTNSASASAEQTVEIKAADVNLTKAFVTRPKYYGDECQYRITLSNKTAFTYEDIGILEDRLDSQLYIKAENLDKMFSDEMTGKKLNVIIKNVSLNAYTGGDATAIDGTDIKLSSENTGVNTGYQHAMENVETADYEIKIAWVNSVLSMTLKDESLEEIATYTIGLSNCNYETIELAMDAIGFFVNTNTAYEVRWDYKGDSFDGNTEIIHLIPANVKDSFMFLDKDVLEEFCEESQNKVISNNQAILYRHSNAANQIKNAWSGYVTGIKRESIVRKDVFHNGKSLGNNFQVNDQEILEYSLDFIHYGNADYEVLPLTDLLSGAQVLLVPMDLNSSTLGNRNLKTYGDEGIGQFYVLTAGSYENIWLSENVCVDSIEVTQKPEAGLDTLIKVYYKNLTGSKNYRKTLSYKALVSTEYTEVTSSSFSVHNTVWANDHQGHRLYYPITGGGVIVRFEKDIVISKGTSPESDVLEEQKHSIVDAGNEVIYRLKLFTRGNRSLELSGKQIYDALPNNGKRFSWGSDKNPVSVSYYCDEGVTISNGNNWFIDTTRPNGQEGNEGEQFLRWRDDFSINFSNGNQFVYIYVTLTFPDIDKNWEDYVENRAGGLIYNTLYVDDMSSTVSHELGAQGKALLQKGVYKISSREFDFDTNSWKENNEYISNTKEIYQNTDGYVHLVTYYTVLYNSGKTRLYLNDLMDELPVGFTFESLTKTTGVHKGKLTSLSNTESEEHKLVSIDRADFIPVDVQAVVNPGEDGHQRIHFTITGKALSYDEQREKYYLSPGEALRFGYLVSTGKENVNVSVVSDAINSIAMPYYDYMAKGIQIDQDTKVSTTILSGYETIKTNDGNRELWTNAAAGSHGFMTNFTDSWLASQVTLKKGNIKPGLIKNVKSYVSATDGKIYDYEGSVNPTDTVTWNVKMVNDGQVSINNYMISDMMEAPYGFIGTVGLDIYNGQDESTADRYAGHSPEKGYLFNIIGREKDENGKNVLLVQSNMNSNVQEIREGQVTLIEEVNISPLQYSPVRANIRVLFENVTDENGVPFEKLSIIFDGSQEYDYWFGIPAGGMALLNISSKNMTTIYENRTYVNHAYITPLTQRFDEYYVTKGVYGTWNDEQRLAYVRNSALVTVSEGFSTSAKKSVYEANNISNYAEENTAKNSILLQNKGDVFTYKLTVRLPDTQVNYITLIDNLPYVEDTMAYAPSVERNSKFTVQLAEEPNFRVTLVQNDGESNQLLDKSLYDIHYHTKHNGYTTADKSGEGEGWVTTVPENVGSIRLFLENKDNLIPNMSLLTLEFDAVIDGEAVPGEFAWNSFGYSYEVSTTSFSAESDIVGVRVPAVPKISKKLVTASNKEYNAEQNETFEFLIYSGSALDLSNKTEAEIYNILQTEERVVTYQQLTVKAGNSKSEQMILNNIHPFTYDNETNDWKASTETWNWIEGATYTVFELPKDSNSYYQYKDLLIQGSSGNTFIYNKNEDCFIQAINERKSGNLLLMKVDNKNQNIFLGGAVFALYSPLEKDQMKPDDIQMAVTEHNLGNMQIYNTISPENSTDTYYLADIQQTDSIGKIEWKNLYGDVYYLQELKAPAGYNLENSLNKVVINFNLSQQIVEVTNEAGYALPESGGMGISSITLSGASLMLTAMAGALVNSKRKQKKKGGEQ